MVEIVKERLHFCSSKDKSRPAITAPFPFRWQDADWEAVTNGHCLLAWPARFGLEPVAASPDVSKVLVQSTGERCEGAGEHTEDVSCPTCDGKSKSDGTNKLGSFGDLGDVIIDRHVLGRVLLPIDGDSVVEVRVGDKHSPILVSGAEFKAIAMGVRDNRKRPPFDGWNK